ncbi:MAG: hypothetical protein U1F83_01170 [Verrucomicrobiota bacterium]
MKPMCYSLLCLAALSAFQSLAHEQVVHQAVTTAAAESALAGSSGFNEFINTISAELALTDATNRMVRGSFNEDFGADIDPVGGFRSLNHFYDPLTGLGLSNIPIDDRLRDAVTGQFIPVGRDSFSWASTRDCPGVDIWLDGIGLNAGKYNIWSWQNARDKEWLGLTATYRSSRQAALLEMFRAVGQFVHLLEDASQPEHTRNEQHLWPGSPIEDYGGKHLESLNYQPGMLDWRAAGFTKMKDFWDRNLYTGGGATLDEDAGGGAKLGLAEFSNGNFLGARHQYPEYFSPGDVRHYPLPSRDNSTNYKQVKADPNIGLDTYTLKNGNEAKGIYIKKNGDGITGIYLSRINYLGAKKFSGLSAKAFCTIDDPNVLYDYHSILIPKAIDYSAGLLDYYFRGKLEVVSVDWDGTQYVITIRNQSGQPLATGGKFFVLKDDASGNNRTYVTAQAGVSLPQDLADGNTWQFNFPGPEIITATKFTLVYQGTVGPASGSSSDPVDVGIAIAAKSFTLGPLNFNNLVWGTPFVAQNGGTASGMWSGNHWTATAIAAGGASAPTADNTAQLNYTGPAVSCNLRVEITTYQGNPQQTHFPIWITQNGVDLVNINLRSDPPPGGVPGIFDFPFTVQGGSSLIEVGNAAAQAFRDTGGSYTATLTPAN